MLFLTMSPFLLKKTSAKNRSIWSIWPFCRTDVKQHVTSFQPYFQHFFSKSNKTAKNATSRKNWVVESRHSCVHQPFCCLAAHSKVLLVKRRHSCWLQAIFFHRFGSSPEVRGGEMDVQTKNLHLFFGCWMRLCSLSICKYERCDEWKNKHRFFASQRGICI